ncbi:hypothetical protein chiPu_0029119 [Chiloscyllium punctatum]|uniref:Uncharacterized protein n=1 Tax=Chiloscyllium punctatum TaxID=137246 RepID=A0A401TQV0_CHIPU|nr:hypothetical protein [Chiloscyllium punctatum]
MTSTRCPSGPAPLVPRCPGDPAPAGAWSVGCGRVSVSHGPVQHPGPGRGGGARHRVQGQAHRGAAPPPPHN